MYPYTNFNSEVSPMCYYYMTPNYSVMSIPAEAYSMYRGEEEFEGERAMPTPPISQMPGQMPSQMDMSKMDTNKIKTDTRDIVRMLEQHHPDLIRPLTGCGMTAAQARQYLTRVVEMSLMHHMMHQM